MKYWIILFLLVLSKLSIGQERVITARVIEAQNSFPIPGAKADVRGSSVSGISNFLGYFQVTADAGDTVLISHPSYVFSRVIIPEAESFQITLEPKYIDLKDLSLDTYPLEAKTNLIIPEFLNESENYAEYASGWQGFYVELGNAIVNHPSFSKFDEKFEYKVRFTISNKGQIQNINTSTEEFQKEVLKSSFNSLGSWSPTVFNDLPISQHFELSISKGNELFTVVEQPAAPPGGYQAFYNYVDQTLKYPALARKKGIEGKVYIQFVVDKDGSLTEVEAVKKIGGGCDEEAVRVVQAAPKWSPPMQRGKPVKQRIIMPITFSLGTLKERESLTLYEYVGQYLRYPSEGRRMGIEGSMYALFEIDNSNSIANIKFISSLGSSFEKAISDILTTILSKTIQDELKKK